MVEVRGCLRSLFIYKGQPMINFETEFERLAKSLIDKPITNNGEEYIGVITDVDINKDEWRALDVSRNTSMSIDIL